MTFLALALSLCFSFCGSAFEGTKATGVVAACYNCATDSASMEQSEEDENAVTRLSLLQAHHDMALRGPSLTQRGQDLLETAIPLAWTHVPKCGTSFVNSLVRLPGVCPGIPFVARNVVYGPPEEGYNWFSDTFSDWPERCPGISQLRNKTFLESHALVGLTFDEVYNGHGVIMLRQPEQRLISMYKHATRETPRAFDPVKDIVGALIEDYDMNVVDFANRTAGCAVRMLTKDSSEPGVAGCLGVEGPLEALEFAPTLKVSAADVIEARRRLRSYAFVGITDHWFLSVCLLHSMFGGDCHPAEFANVRKGSPAVDAYNTSVLKGVVDQYDGALYEEALSIFAENLRVHGVSRSSCQQCLQSAGLDAGEVPL